MTTTQDKSETVTDVVSARDAEAARLSKLAQSMIGTLALNPNYATIAPTTAKVCRVLDAPQTGLPKRMPIEIFSAYDPLGQLFDGAPLQRNLGSIVQFNQASFAAILEAGCDLRPDRTIITDEELEFSRETQIKMDRLRVDLAKYSISSANQFYATQKSRKMEEAISAGVLPTTQIRSREAIMLEFDANRMALTEMLMDLSHKFFPIALEVRIRAMQILRLKMVELEESERELAQAYHHPWAPSHLWKVCAGIQIRIHPQILMAATRSPLYPRDALEGIAEI